tara:strand:- start:19740 stop:19979 length:240 start_codon:yes stop_codon:yes gene_type:complete
MIYYLIFVLSATIISLKVSVKIKNPPIDKDLALIIYFVAGLMIYLIPFELLKMCKLKELEAYAIILTTLYFFSVFKKEK